MSLAALPTLLIVPPVNLAIGACVGAALRRRRSGQWLLGLSLAGLLILAMPVVSQSMLASLVPGVATPTGADRPRAIVILSGDQSVAVGSDRTSYGVGGLTLERERAGALLARRTGLPVLTSGGSITTGAPPLATMMAASLLADFGVATRWTETRSQDTWENAADSAAMLRDAGITRAYVVTHGWHMRRALIAFRRAGIEAVAAPASEDGWPEVDLDHLLPRAGAWQQSYYALHEWIGCAWYALSR